MNRQAFSRRLARTSFISREKMPGKLYLNEASATCGGELACLAELEGDFADLIGIFSFQTDFRRRARTMPPATMPQNAAPMPNRVMPDRVTKKVMAEASR